MATRSRKPVPYPVQVQVFFSQRWLCYLCRKPLVFPLALRQLEELVAQDAPDRLVAYFNLNWRRDLAPLLDELGASVDHVEAFSAGGDHSQSNFAAICARCNARKSAKTRDDYETAAKLWRVKGKHGEPVHWDGLSSVFVALASKSSRPLTTAEKAWLRALKAHFEGEVAP